MAYTGSSASERLAAVRASIDACLQAKQYSVGGVRSKMMAELRDLMELEKWLVMQVDRESGSSPLTTLAQIDNPTGES